MSGTSRVLREKTLVVPADGVVIEDYPFKDDLPLVYLGEILTMPGHGLFAGTKTGKIYSGFHIGNFRELTEDEM